MIGIGKNRGIMGLRKNFSRDRGIEEPYWGPSNGAGRGEGTKAQYF